MTMEILLSCMHQEDTSIVKRSNIQSDVVIINQCDINNREIGSFVNNEGKSCKIKFISTTQRGLSISRNLAIQNSGADVCLISDDDEQFSTDCVNIVTEAFERNPMADVIAFQLKWNNRKYKDKP